VRCDPWPSRHHEFVLEYCGRGFDCSGKSVQISVTILMKSLSFLISFTRFCSRHFSTLHTFSIMFMSGLCAGHWRVALSLSFFLAFALIETWHGALSWKIQGLLTKWRATTGHKLSNKIDMYLSALMYVWGQWTYSMVTNTAQMLETGAPSRARPQDIQAAIDLHQQKLRLLAWFLSPLRIFYSQPCVCILSRIISF